MIRARRVAAVYRTNISTEDVAGDSEWREGLRAADVSPGRWCSIRTSLRNFLLQVTRSKRHRWWWLRSRGLLKYLPSLVLGLSFHLGLGANRSSRASPFERSEGTFRHRRRGRELSLHSEPYWESLAGAPLPDQCVWATCLRETISSCTLHAHAA